MHVKNQMDNRIKNYNLFNTYFKLKKKQYMSFLIIFSTFKYKNIQV